jgi:hypothetical protein
MRHLQASAFQIDNGALFTIKDGEELVVSGGCSVEWKTDIKAPGVARLIPDEGEPVEVQVDQVDDDPAKVGRPARPGQRRVFWSGLVEVDDK